MQATNVQTNPSLCSLIEHLCYSLHAFKYNVPSVSPKFINFCLHLIQTKAGLSLSRPKIRRQNISRRLIFRPHHEKNLLLRTAKTKAQGNRAADLPFFRIIHLLPKYGFCVTGSGTIELDEFVTMMSSRFLEVDEEAELKQSFQVFDKNGNMFVQFNSMLVFLNF